MAAQSLILPSLSYQIPIASSKPKTLTLALSFPSKPFSHSIKHISLFNSFPLPIQARNLDSGLARHVSVSSDYEQDEEEEVSGDEEQSFSPDLKIFVGNLPFSVNSDELGDLFERVGNVKSVEVIMDRLTQRSRGFAFVTMATAKQVEAAVQQFNGYELSGRQLRVNSGPPPPKDEFQPRGFGGGGGGGAESANRVYVGNLSWEVDNSDLETLFSQQGTVVDAKVVYDRESGRSRGFGFVTFSSADEVNDAVSSLNGADLDGRRIRVSVAEERPRRQF